MNNLAQAQAIFGVADECFLPSQLAAPKQYRAEPERRLLLAVLADAFLVVSGHGRVDRNGSTDQNEAVEWFAATRDDYLTSFERICALLGFEADALRQAAFALHRPLPGEGWHERCAYKE